MVAAHVPTPTPCASMHVQASHLLATLLLGAPARFQPSATGGTKNSKQWGERPHLDSDSFPFGDTSEETAHVGLGDELPQLHPLQYARHLHTHPPCSEPKPAASALVSSAGCSTTCMPTQHACQARGCSKTSQVHRLRGSHAHGVGRAAK